MFKQRWVAPGLLAAVLGGSTGGCMMAPKYARPEAPVPAAFPSGGAAYGDAPVMEGATPASEIPWQTFFADERLAAVLAQALENSRNLQIAVLNVERARAMYGVQRSELYPTLDARANMSRQRIPGDLTGSGNAITTEQWGVNMGVASWEIDFFGRIRSLADAGLEQFLATEQAQRSAQIILLANVASTYLALAADRENLKLAQTTLAGQEESLQLVRRRYELGLTPELDVFRAQTQVETARGDVARFTQRVALDRNALELLVGQPVADELLPEDLGAVTPPMELAAGLSSEVLLQRPDIVQAEHLLRSANANIGAARAAFFPRISLTAAIGTASDELSGLFSSGSHAWNYGPQIVMPIFDARVWAAKRVTEVDRELAVKQYERAIQASFREVADALAIRGTVGQQVAAQESLVRSVAETYRLAEVRYERGVDDYLSVLDAQRSLYGAQQALVSLRLAQLANQVTLYQVLGGGWTAPVALADGADATRE